MMCAAVVWSSVIGVVSAADECEDEGDSSWTIRDNSEDISVQEGNCAGGISVSIEDQNVNLIKIERREDRGKDVLRVEDNEYGENFWRRIMQFI